MKKQDRAYNLLFNVLRLEKLKTFNAK